MVPSKGKVWGHLVPEIWRSESKDLSRFRLAYWKELIKIDFDERDGSKEVSPSVQCVDWGRIRLCIRTLS
jgi:hypothetical protein